MNRVLIACACRGDSEPVDVIRVLHRVKGRDEPGAPQGEADPHAGQRVRLGHRAHDEKVFVFGQERKLRLDGEIDVSLIQHDHAL